MPTGDIEPHDQGSALKAVWREMRCQGQKLDRVIAFITKDPMDKNAADGMLQVQEEHGRRLDDVKGRVTNLETQHEANLIKINATRDETDTMRTEHTWTMAWDALKMCMAAAVGAVSAVIAGRPPHP